jgi:L(+)-tartrate dehydratase beta subunit
MDSHGGSLFADNQKAVASRRDAILKSIGAA